MPTAAVLAGGRATRFGGRDKSALILGGQTLLARQIDELAALSDDILIVGGHHQPRGAGVRFVPDRVAEAGPLGGLDAAFEAARHDVLILVACDMPFISGALLAHLVRLAGEADIVIPRSERGYHPLCAVYTRACRPAITRRLASRLNLRMTGLLDEVRVRVVEECELEQFGNTAQLLANVNTPAEFDELESLLGHKLKS
jgi:molybdopterin-guanine dinucleotide biosynthesis protein A